MTGTIFRQMMNFLQCTPCLLGFSLHELMFVKLFGHGCPVMMVIFLCSKACYSREIVSIDIRMRVVEADCWELAQQLGNSE